MVEFNERVLEEAVNEGESMVPRDLFDLVERGHDTRAGVDRDVLGAYARELAGRQDFDFDAEAFLDDVDERTTASETWESDEHFYDLGDDRRSQYPARWHDELGGSDDVTAYLQFLHDEQPAFLEDLDHGGAGGGIPENTLVHVLEVVGHLNRANSMATIEDARDRGVVTEDADQHPRANVYLTERGRDGDGK